MSFKIADYKQKAMLYAIGDEDIVRELDPGIGDASDLVWTRIFPFVRVPETQEQVGRFLLFEVNIPEVDENNDLYAHMEFTVIVLCHKDSMKTEHGATACDYLGGLIMRRFNRNKGFSGGKLRLLQDTASVLQGGGYHYRTLVFGTRDHNGGCAA